MKASGKYTWVGLIAGALLVQALFLFTTWRQPAFQLPVVDAATYHHQATALFTGVPPDAQPYWQAPLYPLTLGVIYRIFGADANVARVFQAFLGVVIVLLTWVLGRRCLSARGAVCAGVGAMLYGPLLFFQHQLLPVTLATVLLSGFVLTLLRLIDRPDWRRAVICGAVLGVTGITVPNTLLLFLVPLIWLIVHGVQHGVGRGPVAVRVAGLIGGLLLLVAPVYEYCES